MQNRVNLAIEETNTASPTVILPDVEDALAKNSTYSPAGNDLDSINSVLSDVSYNTSDFS